VNKLVTATSLLWVLWKSKDGFAVRIKELSVTIGRLEKSYLKQQAFAFRAAWLLRIWFSSVLIII